MQASHRGQEPDLASLEVIVTDGARPGRPVASAAVYLLPVEAEGVDDLSAVVRVGETDARGVVLIDSPTALQDDWAVGVKHPDFLPRVDRVRLSAGSGRQLLVELVRGAVISGRVEDARSGTPVRGARVSYEQVVGDGARVWEYPGLSGAPRIYDLTHVHPDSGAFRIEGLPSGPVRLQARAIEGYLVGQAVLVDAPRDGVVLSLVPSARLRVMVANWEGRPEGVLSVRVLDASSGRLVASSAQRTATGEAEIRSDVPDGEYAVEVESDRGEFGSAPIRVRTPGESVEVRVATAPGPSFEVKRQGGAPLEGWILFVDEEDRVASIVPATGPTLSVRRPAGRHRLRYVDRRSLTAVEELQLSGGDRQTIWLRDVAVRTLQSGADDVGSWTLVDRQGRRRELFQFRGEALVHIGDEVSLREGDRLLVEAAPGGRLRSASRPGREIDLE